MIHTLTVFALQKIETNKVLKICKEEGFLFFVTNPCFEFWLLLHFYTVFSLDINKLKANEKITSKRRYTEEELNQLVPGFKKNNIQFQVFEDKIDNAINNEKLFAEDLSDLKSLVGSNVGKLIIELRRN